ncbi:DNA-3-methyladenine glycosylase family protein [Anthocerotibacter panamensis]|uniref:DNA-3-methyladenine glycosylase family protein n=1 Tax=Anthocerotibacter panamensis TaxID=2857077 RepID=UPI001C405431|nr:DNA-3-methyladenine glycosylase [Anthocerotibacter panamensis]
MMPALVYLQQADPVLEALIEQVGPCQLAVAQEDGDLLEALARAIMFQQLSGKAATTILSRFVALYPDKPFPSAAEILSTPDEKMRTAGVSGQKTRYLKDLAQWMQGGLPTLKELSALDDEEIIRILTQVKGVGRWTVQMLLIFRLGRLDVWPVDDLGVRSGVKKVYRLEELPDKKTLEQLALPWQPYRSVCAWYFWQSLTIK